MDTLHPAGRLRSPESATIVSYFWWLSKGASHGAPGVAIGYVELDLSLHLLRLVRTRDGSQ